MIAVLTVMSDMDLSHDLLGYGWFGSSRVIGSSWFGYRGETCGLYLVFATGVRPVSWWPGLQLDN
jgi:hypothetical protein